MVISVPENLLPSERSNTVCKRALIGIGVSTAGMLATTITTLAISAIQKVSFTVAFGLLAKSLGLASLGSVGAAAILYGIPILMIIGIMVACILITRDGPRDSPIDRDDPEVSNPVRFTFSLAIKYELAISAALQERGLSQDVVNAITNRLRDDVEALREVTNAISCSPELNEVLFKYLEGKPFLQYDLVISTALLEKGLSRDVVNAIMRRIRYDEAALGEVYDALRLSRDLCQVLPKYLDKPIDLSAMLLPYLGGKPTPPAQKARGISWRDQDGGDLVSHRSFEQMPDELGYGLPKRPVTS